MSVVPSLIVLFGVAGVIAYLAMIFNGLVAMRNDIDKAWANIDVLLKQRHDELPRLVEVCKGYMQYEQETLQRVTEARLKYGSAVTVDQKAAASGALSASVQRLLATAENYPELKANLSFLELQKRISELESQIADRREYYNDAINLFNTRIGQVPDSGIARIVGYKPRAMFQVSAAEKAPVPMTFSSVRS
jgi:LemA protein